ncbi:HesB/YadR/YfhF family protein [Ammoniphilus sp. CFH 90114]|uniref:HesB/YadR/YfhF family protein n=1 Tax=Ammoniphilus sp. CFH 90114 TaxID=2493665 RepID=UPI00100F21C6|nr:HesB/YadR/YfhF family protein [Ammoniphilus sp. CFH 90114]RXT08061.1 hypothetical protein EIZ39_11665 [Ammoniphilus sp. CFH 90114]
MKITVTDRAMEWFKDEMNAGPGDYIRFYTRYGGCSTVQAGYSLGVVKEAPNRPVEKVVQKGITFYIEESDLWYFDDLNLKVDSNVDGELIFIHD